MKSRKFLWFLFGLGGQLQIIASLSLTEVFVLIAALFLASREFSYMRENGVMPFFQISIALLIGGVMSGIINNTPPQFLLRGVAVLVLLPSSIIVCHWMLRNDMSNFKWSLVGWAFSGVISTFVFQNAFQRGSIGGGYEAVAAEEIMNGPLWLVHRVCDFAMLYPKGWYLNCPLLISVVTPVFAGGFAIFTSVSGRGTFVRSICSAALMLLGGKKASTIKKRICNHFWFISILGFFLLFGIKTAYQYSASSGLLGEAARTKYETQTKGDKSIGALLLGGRMESFCGLMACVDKPIVGHGPWAMDVVGYTGEFLERFGTTEDYDAYYRSQQHSNMVGLIPCHSYIVGFWCWYGVMGLVFWLYVIFLLLRFLKQDCYAVPQYFMWLAAGVPSFLWDIFLNPFAARVSSMMFVVACLMARAVRKGKQRLPDYMVAEIIKVESK